MAIPLKLVLKMAGKRRSKAQRLEDRADADIANRIQYVIYAEKMAVDGLKVYFYNESLTDELRKTLAERYTAVGWEVTWGEASHTEFMWLHIPKS